MKRKMAHNGKGVSLEHNGTEYKVLRRSALWTPPPCSEQDLLPTALALVETVCNLIMGVGFLSHGQLLWAGKLPRYLVGLLGVTSSILGLHRYLK